MQPFLAMITPVSSAEPPLGIWGGYRPPYVDIGGPGPQPPAGAHPSHPIWRPDLGFWGGRPPNYVDIGFPGPQPHPEHPIVIPPPPGSPPGSPPIAVQLPVFPWTPSHPIELPPEVGPPDIDWKVVWTPATGWIVIGVPSGAHPTPSK